MKQVDKNKAKVTINTGLSVGAEIGGGIDGLAARELLSESVMGNGAAFTDEFQKQRGKGKGKGKQKGGRQAACMFAWVNRVCGSLLTICLGRQLKKRPKKRRSTRI